MIEVKNISKKYGSKAVVNNVSFQIKRGKITSFIGPNGAGKSTVLGMMSRLLKKDSGEVFIDGKEISKWDTKELSKVMGQTLNAGKANGGEYQTAQLNIATATTEERAASAALATANTAYQNAERDYNSVRSANQTRDDKISEFEQANKRISELNEQINRRNEIVNTWDEKHKDKYKELMAYWDMLETGRDSHMGKMYNWGGRSLSAKSAQDKFDNKKQGYINDYLKNYTYRA